MAKLQNALSSRSTSRAPSPPTVPPAEPGQTSSTGHNGSIAENEAALGSNEGLSTTLEIAAFQANSQSPSTNKPLTLAHPPAPPTLVLKRKVEAEDQAATTAIPPPAKRGRGRPRGSTKISMQAGMNSDTASGPEAVRGLEKADGAVTMSRKGRGRPRKEQIRSAEGKNGQAGNVVVTEGGQAEGKKRGRPSKAKSGM